MKDERKTKAQLIEELAALRSRVAELEAARAEGERAGEAPTESEARFRGAFESGMIGTLFWDANGDITDANDVFLQLVGYTRDEVLSGAVRWSDMTPPEYGHLDSKGLEEIAATGVMTPFEKEYIRKDGRRVPVMIGAASLPGPTLSGVAWVLDITERKQAEERLAKESTAVAAIISEMLRGELDDAETELQVLDACLSATESDYGQIGVINKHGKYDTTSYNGRTMQDCAFPEALAWDLSTGMTIRGIWGWPMLHGEPLICNDPKAHPDRVGYPERHVPIRSFLGVPLKRDGEAVGMVAVLNKPGGYTEADMETLSRLAAVMMASRQHRDALRSVRERTVQLEAANRELEAFAYSVSHDLRAPLRSMDGFSQVLLEDYSDKFDEDGRDYLRRVRGAAQRMAELIDGLLELARVSRKEMILEEVDLSALVRRMANRLAESQPGRDVEIVVEDGFVVRGDRRLLQVVLENLVGNAWKFTSKQAAARIEFGAVEREGERAYFVRDNGAGFDPAYTNKLFGAFQRLHSTAEFDGSGIGLATVQRIVRRHGGRTWAEGAVGKGATFYFALG